MINLFHKKVIKEQGAVTLLLAIVLVVLSTLMVIFAANIGRVLDQSVANQNRNAQAFQAAQAGMEFGINYLAVNAPTIIPNTTGSTINYSNSSTTNISLANGSKYSVVYTNPVANNYQLIQITSTGTSDDSTATRVVRQQVDLGGLLVNEGFFSIVGKGNVTLNTRSEVINTTTNLNIYAGGIIDINNNANTTTSSGTASTPSGLSSDVSQNQSALSSMALTTLFAYYFGTTTTSNIQSQVDHAYSSSSNRSYGSTIGGMTNTSIWIDQTGTSTATISNVTIGSATQPVLLIVNGRLTMSNTIFYGFIFVLATSGTTNLSGTTAITGGLVTANALTLGGDAVVTYNSTVTTNLKVNSAARFFAKVPGSWRDF